MNYLYNMQRKKIALSFLLIIAVIVKTLNIDPIIDLICLFTTCFVISYNCFNKVDESIKYAVFLTIIFYLLKILLNANRYVFSEHLENSKTNDGKEDIKVYDERETKKEEFKEELNDLEQHLLDLDGKDEKHDKKVTLDDMSPAQAQRELYRLVDTTNLLKKTMTEMAPVLNEGKKIMKSIEALNMIN
jgi:hypothetical protein